MERKQKKILFYYLSAFSHTGGIEKFNRCFIKALNELSGSDIQPSIVSVYDGDSDVRYNDALSFKGFNRKRSRSVFYFIKEALRNDVVILGHINLAIAGLVVKLLKPSCKLVVIAHGIEVWKRLPVFKKMCLRKANIILAVSNYTKNQLVLKHDIAPEKIYLFPNTIDPYFKIPNEFHKPDHLLKRYGLSVDQPVILTLSRLTSTEQYKGYDKVIAAMPAILKNKPDTKYILAGKYDTKEKKRIEDLVKLYNIEDHVLLTGFVPDEEVPDHYRLADVFIMPSRKEGFGIVFLEALACGTAVIGGNQDGTVDALLNGLLGTLINPTKTTEIASAVVKLLKEKAPEPEYYQKNVLAQYRFLQYKKRLEAHLS